MSSHAGDARMHEQAQALEISLELPGLSESEPLMDEPEVRTAPSCLDEESTFHFATSEEAEATRARMARAAARYRACHRRSRKTTGLRACARRRNAWRAPIGGGAVGEALDRCPYFLKDQDVWRGPIRGVITPIVDQRLRVNALANDRKLDARLRALRLAEAKRLLRTRERVYPAVWIELALYGGLDDPKAASDVYRMTKDICDDIEDACKREYGLFTCNWPEEFRNLLNYYSLLPFEEDTEA